MRERKLVTLEIENGIMEMAFIDDDRFTKLNIQTQLDEINEIFQETVYDYRFNVDSESLTFFKEMVQEARLPNTDMVYLSPQVFFNQIANVEFQFTPEGEERPHIDGIRDKEMIVPHFLQFWSEDIEFITQDEIRVYIDEEMKKRDGQIIEQAKEIYIREGESDISKKDKRSASVFRYKGKIINTKNFKRGE